MSPIAGSCSPQLPLFLLQLLSPSATECWGPKILQQRGPDPASLTLASRSVKEISLINFNRALNWSKQPLHNQVFLTQKEMGSIPLLTASPSSPGSRFANPWFV